MDVYESVMKLIVDINKERNDSLRQKILNIIESSKFHYILADKYIRSSKHKSESRVIVTLGVEDLPILNECENKKDASFIKEVFKDAGFHPDMVHIEQEDMKYYLTIYFD